MIILFIFATSTPNIMTTIPTTLPVSDYIREVCTVHGKKRAYFLLRAMMPISWKQICSIYRTFELAMMN